MVKKRGPGRPPKKRRGRPKGSKNKHFIVTHGVTSPLLAGDKITFAKKRGRLSNKDKLKRLMQSHSAWDLEYIKDYNETPSFRSRLEAATVKFEQAINETIEQLKGKI